MVHPPPEVTLVVPVYNTGSALRECLDSCMAQTVPCGIVLVDDGSSDPETLKVLDWAEQSVGMRVIRHPANRGVAAALNTGLNSVRTPLVLPVGSDDILMSTLVERALPEFRDESVVAVTWWLEHFGANDHISRPPGAPNGLQDLVFGNEIPGASLIRTHHARGISGWREGLPWGEDWDFWLRLFHSEQGHCVVIPEVLYRYRQHAGQVTTRLTFEEKHAHHMAIVDANQDIWAGQVAVVMDRFWRQQQRLWYLHDRYGRINVELARIKKAYHFLTRRSHREG